MIRCRNPFGSLEGLFQQLPNRNDEEARGDDVVLRNQKRVEGFEGGGDSSPPPPPRVRRASKVRKYPIYRDIYRSLLRYSRRKGKIGSRRKDL